MIEKTDIGQLFNPIFNGKKYQKVFTLGGGKY
jgi:hypothetical protein